LLSNLLSGNIKINKGTDEQMSYILTNYEGLMDTINELIGGDNFEIKKEICYSITNICSDGKYFGYIIKKNNDTLINYFKMLNFDDDQVKNN
jgi:hypothetical protein